MNRGRRAVRGRVNRTWSDLSATWVLSGVTADASVELMAFEEPTPTVFTAMPPEDIIIDRVVGAFTTSLTPGAANWTLGMLVADRGWVPGTNFAADCDKRILWHETYNLSTAVTGVFWNAGGTLESLAPTTGLYGITQAAERMYRVDITPRVRLTAGKALILAAWENSGAGSLTTGSTDMRVLWHRARR